MFASGMSFTASAIEAIVSSELSDVLNCMFEAAAFARAYTVSGLVSVPSDLILRIIAERKSC